MTHILTGTQIASVSFALDRATYYRLNIKVFLYRPITIFIFFIALLNLGMGMLKLINETNITSLSFLPFESNFVIAILLFVLYPLLILIRIKRGAQSKSIGRLTYYEFYEDGISIRNDSTYIEHKWDALVQIEEQKDHLLIYPRRDAAYVISKEAMDKVSYLYLKELMLKQKIRKKFLK